jgi:hypothetical protein
MGCGHTLILGSGGYVTCGYLPCPDPTRVDQLLDDAEYLHALVTVADAMRANKIAGSEGQSGGAVPPVVGGAARLPDQDDCVHCGNVPVGHVCDWPLERWS